MYSKNDYRYYLEHRLEESDDYLAHYGVKGMKWKKHKRGPSTEELRKSENSQADQWNARVRQTNGKMNPVEAIGRGAALRTTIKKKHESYPQAKVKKKLNKVKSKLESRSTRKWVKDTSVKAVSHNGNVTRIMSETTYSKKNPAAHRAGQGKAVLSNATAPIIKEAQKKTREKKRIRKKSNDWIKKH